MAGPLGAMSQVGNTELIEHGIQNENSHLRAHVCPLAHKVYVFPTQKALDTIATGNYKQRPARQPGINVITAIGYLVPPFDIEQCVGIALRPDVWDSITWDGSLKWKGRQATTLVMGMIRRGMFPIPAIGSEIEDRDLQIDGTDIIIRAGAIRQQDIIIQVKCDLPGGEHPGSGNLYLQTEECNPFRIY